MANNRMWLVNERLGERVLIAKHLGGGWFVSNIEGLSKQLDETFGFDVGTDWKLEYEHQGDV
jgi:hypothetical protein